MKVQQNNMATAIIESIMLEATFVAPLVWLISVERADSTDALVELMTASQVVDEGTLEAIDLISSVAEDVPAAFWSIIEDAELLGEFSSIIADVEALGEIMITAVEEIEEVGKTAIEVEDVRVSVVHDVTPLVMTGITDVTV